MGFQTGHPLKKQCFSVLLPSCRTDFLAPAAPWPFLVFFLTRPLTKNQKDPKETKSDQEKPKKTNGNQRMQEIRHRPEHELATTSKLPTRNNGKIFEASLLGASWCFPPGAGNASKWFPGTFPELVFGPVTEMFQNGVLGASWSLFPAQGWKCSKRDQEISNRSPPQKTMLFCITPFLQN